MEVSESESLPLTPSGAIFNRTPSPSPARSNVFDALQPVMLHESKISFDHSQHIQFPFSKLSVVQHLREDNANVKKLTTSTSCHDHPSILHSRMDKFFSWQQVMWPSCIRQFCFPPTTGFEPVEIQVSCLPRFSIIKSKRFGSSTRG